MTRKVERLTLDTLARLAGHATHCVFWELDPVRRAAVRGHEAEEKAAWLSGALREWGSVGRVLLVDGVPVGHVLWAPARFLPGADGFATAPVSTDAMLLAELHVEPEHRGQGYGRLLVQTMAKDMVKHGGVGAIETFGALRPRAQQCVLPTEFLLGVGFRTHRAHPQFPRMRMDLRTTVTWREEFEAAAEKILGVVKRPARQPAPRPAPRAVRREVSDPDPGPAGAR